MKQMISTKEERATRISTRTDNTIEFEYNNLTIMLVNDVTQIIKTDKVMRKGLKYNSHQKNLKKLETKYEREWKINTKMNKFYLVSVFTRKTHDLIIEGLRI